MQRFARELKILLRARVVRAEANHRLVFGDGGARVALKQEDVSEIGVRIGVGRSQAEGGFEVFARGGESRGAREQQAEVRVRGGVVKIN